MRWKYEFDPSTQQPGYRIDEYDQDGKPLRFVAFVSSKWDAQRIVEFHNDLHIDKMSTQVNNSKELKEETFAP